MRNNQCHKTRIRKKVSSFCILLWQALASWNENKVKNTKKCAELIVVRLIKIMRNRYAGT